MLIILKNLHINYELNRSKDKGVIKVSFGYHDNHVTIAMRYMADAYHPEEPPYQIRSQDNLYKRIIEVSLWLPC